MHKNEPSLEVLQQMLNNVTNLTDKQVQALKIQIKRRVKEAEENKTK